MARAVPTKVVNRAPTEAEQRQIAGAIDRGAKRKWPVKVEVEGNQLAPPHSDAGGHMLALMDALGTKSREFVAANVGGLEAATRERGDERGDSSVSLNAALAIIQAVDPEDELEGALAVQMAGTHALALEMLGKAKLADRTDHLQLYGNLAVKCQRTFTAQIEALARLRGKGQQTVRVEHVTVQPGAQAIVGDVHHHPGGSGDHSKVEDQSRAQQSSNARVPALPGPDPSADGMPITRHDERPVSHARRHKPGRAKG